MFADFKNKDCHSIPGTMLFLVIVETKDSDASLGKVNFYLDSIFDTIFLFLLRSKSGFGLFFVNKKNRNSRK